MKKNLTRYLFILLFSLPYFALADEYFVTTNADSGPGSLRAEIENAISNVGSDTVIIDVTGIIALESPIDIDDGGALTVIGPHAKHLTIRSGSSFSDAGPLIDINNAKDVTIQFIRFEEGDVPRRFVEIDEYSGNIRFNSCVFEGNELTAIGGGAMYIGNPYTGTSGTVEINACSFIDNMAAQGGALFVADGNLTVSNCTFYLNQAPLASGNGGAVYVESTATGLANVNFRHNTFKDNVAGGSGNVVHGGGNPNISFTNNAGAGNGFPDPQFTGTVNWGSGGGNRFLSIGTGSVPFVLLPSDIDGSSIFPGLRDTLLEDGYGLKYYTIAITSSSFIDAGEDVSLDEFDCRRSPRVATFGITLPDAGACERSRRYVNSSAGGISPGTLEWALGLLAVDSFEYVEFDFPTDEIIAPDNNLIVNNKLYIDGFSQHNSAVPGPGTLGSSGVTPAENLVYINASGLTNGVNLPGGTANGSFVTGLRITGSDENGILIKADDVRVFGCELGITTTAVSLPNDNSGISIDADAAKIGGRFHWERNIISGNGAIDLNSNIEIDAAATGAMLCGNFIGVAPNGTSAITGDNALVNIEIYGSGTLIGEAIRGCRNLIGGSQIGIEVSNATNTRIYNNYIGLTYNGLSTIPNSTGVFAASTGGGSDLKIGKPGELGRNVISGNLSNQVRIGWFNGVEIANNYIGTNASGTGTPLGLMALNGILVDHGSANNVAVGISFGGEIVGNVISGNQFGIQLSNVGTGFEAIGNIIGLQASGYGALPNTEDGILVLAAVTNSVQIGQSNRGNIISGQSNPGSAGIRTYSSAPIIQANWIGLDSSGTSPEGNNVGIVVENANDVTIGGGLADKGNVISGNATHGVLVKAGNNVQIMGNLIGTDEGGATAVPNMLSGINIKAGTNTIIGGSVANRNIISGNIGTGAVGILLDSTGTGTMISANYIGLDISGSGALGNWQGIRLNENHNASIGGNPSTGLSNYIANSTTAGVSVNSPNDVLVDGNIIGLNISNAAASNYFGVEVIAPYAEIGLTHGNTISANTLHGIYITGSDSVFVNNNHIGTNSLGLNGIGNGGDGVHIDEGEYNQIGTLQLNVIAGNTDAGIRLTNNSNQNLVFQNNIGFDADSPNANNAGIIVRDGSEFNVIGNIWLTQKNTISFNTNAGIRIEDSDNNFIPANTIGNEGLTTLGGNEGNGIEIIGSNGTEIGDESYLGTGRYNVISENAFDGIYIENSDNTIIYGNTIGLNQAGNTVYSNGQHGISIDADSDNTRIGSSGSIVRRNTISGNTGNGIFCDGSNSIIRRNFIGMNITGSVLLDTQNNGIVLGSNSNLNIVGGSRLTDYNVICGNEDFGVQLFGTQDSVLGNYFGLNDAGILIAGHFQDYAVVLDSDASENQIGKEGGLIYGNIITNETDGGILIRNSASDNEVVGNYVGINDADTPLGLMDHGVLIQESAGDGNRIGRPVTGGGNIISNNNYGIIIDGADNQFVEHNRIGTNASGAGTVENFTTGIYIHNGAEGNTIGGSGDAGNLISGNAVYGVQIGGLGTDNNEVLGNIIGLNLALDAAIDNSIGIYIEDGASDNVIGKAGDFGNIICANELAGIIVDGTGTDDNLIFNNKIGPIFGNRHGVIIRSGASGTYLGGESIGEGNVVSNNDSTAIVLDNVNGNFVYGNKVGLTVVGSEALPNNIGIHVINSSANYIGNTGDYRGNVISANSMGGIIFDGSNSNFLYNNILGLDSAGLSDFTGGGNAFGVFLNNGSTNNQIGGSTSGQGNVVSGNNNFGIGFDGTTNNFVYGNYIGLNKDGSALYPNTLEGLILVNNASSNQIGGTEDGMINSIAGHFTNILLVNTDNVSIVNNNIGNNHLGDDTLSGAWTQSRGINLVAGSSSNTIQGNIISGLNQGVGIRLEGEGTDDNQIRSNRIGLTRSGDSRLNNREGIFVTDTASNNIIGGDDVADGNIISGNTLAHTAIEGEMTDGNVVKSNYFGLDPTGASSFNATYGIGVFNEAENNRIEANYLADFDSVAIFLFNNSESTLIQGNSIGLSPSGSSLPGADTCGIYIDNAHNNVIGGTDPLMSNTITNCKKGIAIKGDGDENSILRNSIYANSGLGIDLADDGLVNPIDGMLTAGGGNQNIDQPKILSAFACEDGGNIKVLFETNVPESVTYHFEFFQNSTASGQGETYINSFDVIPATNPDTIAFELGYPLAEGTEITMTASRLTFGSNGITSEFSEGFIIEASPDLEISTSDVSCGANNDGSIEVNSSGTFYSQLASNPADTINDQIIYESLGAGTYPLTISYPNGCVVGPTDVTINILDLTGVNAIDDQEVCIGSQVQLDAFGGTEYEWDEDDDLSELDVPDPVATVNEDKYFYVTITHDTGCEIRDSVYVSLLPLDQCNLIVYNSFTPNNDGLNDFFYIEGIEGYPENKVTFFNRWGDSILSIDNYDNDQNIWSGNKRDGNDAKEGTYFFVINVGGVQSQSGWVQLIR